jgi:hypothetical protein
LYPILGEREEQHLTAASSAGITVGYRLDGLGLIPSKGNGFSLQSIHIGSGATQPPVQWELGTLSPGGRSGWSMKMTTHHHLMLMSRLMELHLHSNICLYGVVLN